MEGYKEITDRAAVPSLPLSMFILFLTLISYYSNYYSFNLLCAAIFFLLLFFISSFLCIRRYSFIFIKQKKLIIKNLVLLVIIVSTLSFAVFQRIEHITDKSTYPLYIENFSTIVTNVEKKRYSCEITARADINDRITIPIILLYKGDTQLHNGDRLFIHKRINRYDLNQPSTAMNRYWFRGISFTSVIYDEDITIIENSKPGLRDKTKDKFYIATDRIFDKDSAALVKALFTGNQSYISKDVNVKFRNAGILHILSASGLHVAIVAGFPSFLLLLGISRRFVFTLSFFSVTLYLLMTDMPVSLVRAAVMFFFVYAQILLYRKTNILNNLLLAAAFIILVHPWEVFSIGFQLSFAATLGIILFYDSYRYSLRGINKYIRNSAALTLSAQVFTTPIIIYHLQQMNTISVFSNILVIPLISLFIYTSFITLLLSGLFTACALWGANITYYVYKTIYFITAELSDFNMNFHIENLSFLLIILLLLSLFPLIPAARIQRLKFFPVLASIIGTTAFLSIYNNKDDRHLQLSAGNSRIEITGKPDYLLSLDINNFKDSEILLSRILSLNMPVKKIVLYNDTPPNMNACRLINNELIVDECYFMLIPSISRSFKNLADILEKDNVTIKFKTE